MVNFWSNRINYLSIFLGGKIADIFGSSRLDEVMGNEPNKQWGSVILLKANKIKVLSKYLKVASVNVLAN
ncbi:Uncharacterised protein [Sphingobacterium multivorum]|uniref:Uncharacterized protein n=1 Tax=Sphingobacterium multivorum TaxID=28454 RepID=A0A2X2JLU0_SPHMU|nr:Uncharacterised protein [Sphingobacterium multivorum]HAK28897.1 hypothetical protein [Sphingobacterium sp.]